MKTTSFFRFFESHSSPASHRSHRSHRSHGSFGFLLLLCSTLTCLAAGLPELVLPQGVGVNIHFTRGHEKDLDLIAAAGFKFIRMDFGWASIERAKGQYDWSAYDDLTANLEQRGLRAIYILDYSNPLYEETSTSKNPITGKEERALASPQHPESIEAFARWAAAAAKHFHGRKILWEIWNEPNISFWKPKPDVKQYTALALATCKAIREVEPQAAIVGPATSGIPMEFLGAFLGSGILAQLDAVSVHPYRNYTKSPETALADYQQLRKLIEYHAPAPAKKLLPILSGEWGYATHTKGVSLETQAAFIARQQLANLYAGVPLSIWYDWKNDGPDPAYNEHNFGAVTTDLQPKPAYITVQTLTRELSGYHIARRLDTGDEKQFALLLAKSGAPPKLAAWTTGEPVEIKLDLALPAGPLPAVDGKGQPLQPKVEQGRLIIKITELPQYVTLPNLNK
jgi:hypothetical protein